MTDPIANLEPNEEVIERINKCADENPCEASWQAAYAYASDRAYDLAVFQALQGIAFGVMQYASADRTADRQYDIADRQMIIAEEEYQRYKDNFIACEEALNEEVCALEQTEVEYDLYGDRIVRDVRKSFSLARQKMNRARKRYCFHDLIVDICDSEKTEALAVVAARNLAYREAEARRDKLDADRWARKTWGVDLGRQVMTGQSGMYSGAMGMASQAVGAQGNAMRSLLGTLSGATSAIMNAHYAPHINAPSVFGIDNRHPGFDTHWGRFQGGTISRN